MVALKFSALALVALRALGAVAQDAEPIEVGNNTRPQHYAVSYSRINR